MPQAKNILAALSLLAFCGGLAGAAEDARELVRESLRQRYRVTAVGTKLLGLAGDRDTIQRPGTLVTLAQGALHGTFTPDQAASYAIRELDARLMRGREEVPLPQGEKFYVHSIYVGSDVITLGLISVRQHSAADRTGRLWLTLNFFLPAQTLAAGDMAGIYSVLDQWLVSGETASAPPPSPSQTDRQRRQKASATRVELQPGMSRAEVAAALGEPEREVSFGEQRWLSYPGLLVTIERGGLVSVSAYGQMPAQVSVASEPPGADIYLDDVFVGSAPAKLELPAGTYRVRVEAAGHLPWERDLRVLAGSQLSLRARLQQQ